MKSDSWKLNLYIVWTAQLLGAIGMSACLPFLPLYVRELGVRSHDEAQVWAGLVYSASFFFSALLTPYWGALGDRYGRRLMLLRAYIGVAIMTLLMGMVHSVEQLFLLRLLQGALSGFVAGSIALVAVTTPAEHTGFALGFLQTSLSSGNILGPLIGGISADFFGLRPAFYLVSSLCLTSAVVIALFSHENPAAASELSRSPQRTQVRDNLLFALKNRELRVVIVLLFLGMLGLSATQPVLAYFVEQLGAPSAYIGTVTGALVAMLGLLGIIFAPYWGRMSDGESWQRVLRLSVPVIGVSTLLQGFVPHYLFLFPLRFVMGIFSAGMLPMLFAAISRQAPIERRGGLMAFGSSATMSAQLVSPALSGWVAARLGMQWSFILAASFFFLMATILNRFSSRRVTSQATRT
ncbi:MAG: MFS transporter [Oligoflexia bacterium]|nr:MFS transporter [Oligoflexia bacterium]